MAPLITRSTRALALFRLADLSALFFLLGVSIPLRPLSFIGVATVFFSLEAEGVLTVASSVSAAAAAA